MVALQCEYSVILRERKRERRRERGREGKEKGMNMIKAQKEF